MSNLIPARYIGGHTVLLAEHQGDHYDANGNRLTSNRLVPGDTLMIPNTEVLGETLYEDIPGSGRLRSLGPGRTLLPEHADKTAEELALLGYVFYGGRPDFEPLIIIESASHENQEKSSRPAKAGKHSSPDAAE